MVAMSTFSIHLDKSALTGKSEQYVSSSGWISWAFGGTAGTLPTGGRTGECGATSGAARHQLRGRPKLIPSIPPSP